MWLCLPSAYLSIVALPRQPDHLLVRARRPGDIETLFPEARVDTTPGRDYLYRARIERAAVAAALARHVATMNYPNFKQSVSEPQLHRAYGDLWRRMARLQAIPPYARRAP